ncbi:hypothetical protein INS49_008722 [Diaporthe citri]|uniref:uncharacterized protein n=1 Tax=Diaporthe citri TaxID=83186 RepID=UPI001C802265|nr:uncharacterized protein INS49_008722 [Diaporthe citri]KAG6363621.1 hypothetical protein INS49_008722 [Diaporthe citri]
MSQDASSEMEDLEAEFRLLNERCRRLQAQKEGHLQQAISTYETDRAAGQDDIKKKELALHELEAKYNEELRVKREALQTALQREVTRKRKHDAEVQHLNQQLTGLKRLKQGNLELSVLPSTQTAWTYLCGINPILTVDFPNRPTKPEHLALLDLPITREIFTTNRCLPLSQPGRDDKPAEDNGPNEEFTTEGVESMCNGDESIHLTQSRPLTEKTIPYEEVYQMAQDPQAKYKHWILEHPEGCGNWYIVRCKEHNLNWSDKPLPAASRHLVSRWHMFPSKKAFLAIKELGELVENCDQQKAKASNTEYKKALDQGYKPQNTMEKSWGSQRKRRSAKKKADAKSGQDLVGSFKGVIDPVVGEVYHAWWDAEPRSWYPVVILPYLGDGDWKEVGITGNLFTSGLKKEIPNCFKVVKATTDSGKEASRLTWAEGYQDGGPKVRARKFPCLFLHDPLTIPSADQEFVLGHTAEVLAFRTAQQLRQRSTVLDPGLSKTGVDANKGLARDFEARLRAIRAKQNPTPEQEIEDNVGMGALSVRDQHQQDQQQQDQQYLNATNSVEAKESPCASPASNAQDHHHHSTGNDLFMPGDGHDLATRNPRVSLPSRLGNASSGQYGSSQGAVFDQIAERGAYPSVTSTTSTTHSPSPNGEECNQSRAKSCCMPDPSTSTSGVVRSRLSSFDNERT